MKTLKHLTVAAALLALPLAAATPAAASSLSHDSTTAVEQEADTIDTAITPAASNPYTPQQVCNTKNEEGSYTIIDSHKLGKAGTVYLLYNATNKHNCVTTIKHTNVGTATWTEAGLKAKGKSWSLDSGYFTHYAGPVKQKAAGTCVKWGGVRGGNAYTSSYEHCG